MDVVEQPGPHPQHVQHLQHLHQQQPPPAAAASRRRVRRTGLSAFYTARSQSFSSMSDLQKNPFSQSAVCLAKRSLSQASWTHLAGISEAGLAGGGGDACDPDAMQQPKRFAATLRAAAEDVDAAAPCGRRRHHHPVLARHSWDGSRAAALLGAADGSPAPCWHDGDAAAVSDDGGDQRAAQQQQQQPWPADVHVLAALHGGMHPGSGPLGGGPCRSPSPCSSSGTSGSDSSSDGERGVLAAEGGRPCCCWCDEAPTDHLCAALSGARLAGGLHGAAPLREHPLLGFTQLD